MKTLIIPCAGKSSRFPDMKPKYLLTHPDGNLMIKKALDGLMLEQFDRILISIVKEHNEKFESALILRQLFEMANNPRFELLILKQFTSCQAETVFQTIKEAHVTGQIVVKDADNFTSFESGEIESNSVGGINIETFPKEINRLGAKSFLVVNTQNIIIDIIERKIKSNIVCVGIYSFDDANVFCDVYLVLRESALAGEIYVSHIISYLIGVKRMVFIYKNAKEYEDWGTLKDWRITQAKNKTYFIDLDGVLLKNKGKYGSKNWDNYCEPIEENLKVIKHLFDEGAKIVITTSREEKYFEQIKLFLSSNGIKEHAIVTGCTHASRVIINDFAPTNPYPACEAINIPRNGNLSEYLCKEIHDT
jgi:hypothetical protein